MEAGAHMKAFSDDIFENLDKGKRIDNLVLLNSHLLQSIEGICKVKGARSQHKYKYQAVQPILDEEL
jgi:hypothetical protein